MDKKPEQKNPSSPQKGQPAAPNKSQPGKAPAQPTKKPSW